MGKNKKRRSTNGASSNKPSPRRGDKTKQTKVAKAKETDRRVVRQTKLSFADSPTLNSAAALSTAITPDAGLKPKRLAHPTPPSTPERDNPKTTITKNDPTTPTEIAPSNEQNLTKPPSTAPSLTENAKGVSSMPNAKGVASKPDSHMTTEDNEDIDSGNKKKKQTTFTITDDDAKPAAKQSKPTKPTVTAAILAARPAAKVPRKQYQEIRYRGIIDAPPSEKPLSDFVTLLKKYLKTVQSTIGRHIYLAPWDKEQESSFPHLRTPADVPDSRESLGIYLGTYVNPRADGNAVWMNLRWVTSREPPVPLERFGIELADALPKHKMSMNKQPQPCQAVKSCCIGWFMYSCKQINSTSFINETKIALGIPKNVAIGISYRTIVNQYGKKPPFNREDPPAAAIHLDIDERFYMVYQAKASSLWRKNSKKRLPNGVQLRLVPCFSSPIGKSMTDEIRSDAKTLAERQYLFVKEHLRVIDYHFISLLDTPIATDNPMTLRRAMMARAPKDRPTSRLIHNIDQSWNSTSKYVVTTVIGREEEANRFLSNLIPELLFVHGQEASKWFSGQGLSIYKDVRWNAKKGTTSSSNASASAAMVEEDVWDLGDKWKALTVASQKTSTRPDAKLLDVSTPSSLQEPQPSTEAAAETATPLARLASDKSVASFGGAFGREHDSDDEKEAEVKAAYEAANPPDMTGTQFIFSPAQVERANEKALQGSESDGLSMSTAGKTTDRTRLRLKMAQEEIVALKLKAKEELEALKTALQAQNNPSMIPLPPEVEMEDSTDDMDIDHGPRDNQLLGAALSAPKRETVDEDSDAMEEDEHDVVYMGDAPGDDPTLLSSDDEIARQAANLEGPDSSTAADSLEENHSIEFIGSDPSQSSASDPSQASASDQPSVHDPSHSSRSKGSKSSSSKGSKSETLSSASSSSSSDGSHNTALLIEKITKLTTPKNMIKVDRPGGSTDSVSQQSSGQNSGSSKDHIPEASSGKAGVVLDDAGKGE
jgi:hypothetical protein